MGFLHKLIFEEEPITSAVHYTAEFVTVDGVKHYDNHFHYVNPDVLVCTVPEFLMINVKYFKDDNGIMYPLQNVVSIHWVLDSIINVKGNKWYYKAEDAVE